MKKILFVIGTMTNGGAERVISVLSSWICFSLFLLLLSLIIK